MRGTTAPLCTLNVYYAINGRATGVESGDVSLCLGSTKQKSGRARTRSDPRQECDKVRSRFKICRVRGILLAVVQELPQALLNSSGGQAQAKSATLLSPRPSAVEEQHPVILHLCSLHTAVPQVAFHRILIRIMTARCDAAGATTPIWSSHTIVIRCRRQT